jgi:ubiquinone/menaquinone biosynthesis C-methylase UbiE
MEAEWLAKPRDMVTTLSDRASQRVPRILGRKLNLAATPNRFCALLGSASPRMKRRLWRQWYDLLAGRYQQTDWTFMNYGYAAVGAEAADLWLAPADEADRYPIQLYHQVAGAVDLRGAAVLEVGCGRGGGCAYIARYMQPRSVLGIDFSAKAIDFCNRVHSVPGLSFQRGEAEALPCRTESFDAVVNVESSHCYGSIPAFLDQVYRVLKPGGYFLWADLQPDERLVETRRQFRDAGLLILEETVITPNVLHALDRISDQKRETIRRLVPRPLVRSVQDFAGVRGTRVYESLRAGTVQYPRCVLQKPH